MPGVYILTMLFTDHKVLFGGGTNRIESTRSYGVYSQTPLGCGYVGVYG